MKRSLLGVAVIASLAATANAAQVTFFLASPTATNGATSGLAAATLGVNPEVLPGVHTVELWMQLNSNEFPLDSGTTIFGGSIDMVGSNAALLGAGGFGGPNPAIWNGGYTNGAAGNVWSGLTFLSTNAGLGSPNAGSTATGPIFMIGSGTLTAGAPGNVYLQLPGNTGIGLNNSTGAAGLAFGWGGGGLPNTAALDSANAPQLLMSDIGAFPPSAGFVGSSLDGGPVTSAIPNLVVTPEPATMALLCLGGLLIRRRK